MTHPAAPRRILTKIAFAAIVATRLAVQPAQAAQHASDLLPEGKGTHPAVAGAAGSMHGMVRSLEAFRALGLVRPTRALP